MLLRLPLTALIGGALSIGLFWVLWHLISQPINVGPVVKATRIEFTRMRRDTEVKTKQEEKVTRTPPPPTPQVPKMDFASAGLSSNVINIDPVVNTGGVGKISLTAGSDTDVIPLVRIPPDYPPRALERGVEGWVQVEFTITETGGVKDAKVVAAQPRGIFDEAALRSIARWRYNPKVEDGKAVARVGMQTVIKFQLSNK
jgi:protein TonB